MKTIYKILIRVIVLIVLLIAFNRIYVKFFWQEDIYDNVDIWVKLNKKLSLNPEILYFGESSNFTWASTDKEKKSISIFISEYFPELNFQTIDKGALHAKLYLNLLKNIPDTSSVKTIIITMNYRSFNADWINSKIETSLMKMNEFMNPNILPIINRFTLSLKTFNNLTHKERKKKRLKEWKKSSLNEPKPFNSVYTWNKNIYKKGFNDASGNYDSLKTQLAGHYVKSYAFLIDTLTNPRIQDFDEIVEYAKKRNWNLIFNIVAENVQKADELIGVRLLKIFHRNRDLLMKRYNKHGVIVVDNLEKVEDKQFIDQDWTSEHYYEKGRKIIARNVALNLKKIYKPDFVDIRNKLHFFNDMEGNIEWNNMSSIVSEKSFSGDKACKINNKQKYSISFVSELSEVGLACPDKVEISYKSFLTSENNTVELVVELIKNEQKLWENYPINSNSTNINKWTNNSVLFDIPKEFRGATIKIYVWNNSNESAYIDDIDLRFQYNSIINDTTNGTFHLINNFETTDNSWGNFNTISNEKALSGLHSAKIFKQFPFSPTFKERIFLLDNFNQIEVSVNSFTENKNFKAQLTIEIANENLQYFRKTIKLYDKNDSINQWKKISLKSKFEQYNFPNTYLKVYVWNPNENSIFIDDFEIKLSQTKD